MDDADHEAARRDLVASLRRRLDVDERTLAAIGSVPRHAFVPEGHRSRAYADRPLPIGH
ncbi:protein-L-isoaspartate O-methyltransferase, partial [Halorubrum sp. E3]